MGFWEDLGKRPVERPERIKLVSSAVSTADIFNSFLFSCSTAMFLLSAIFTVTVFRAPTEFVPEQYIDKKIWGIRPRRAIAAPFFLVGGINLVCGYVTHQYVQQLSGNTAGFLLNTIFGFSLLWFRKISWFYPAMGAMYMSFGFLHHYRRLGILTDNAPLFNWSDFSEIQEYRKKKRLGQVD